MANSSENFDNIILKLLGECMSGDYKQRIFKCLRALSKVASADVVLFFEVASDRFLSFAQSYIDIPNQPTPDITLSNIFTALFLSPETSNKPKSPREICAINHEIFNTSNFYKENFITTDEQKKLDEALGTSTVSLLSFPLYNDKQSLIGVIQIMNPRDSKGKITRFTEESVKNLLSLGNIAAMQVEQKRQTDFYNRLLESFIEVIAKAIDNKSPYTGEHCQKVPVIARMLATAAIAAGSGPFKDFDMKENEWYALHVASLLHDCGKISTPDYIVDKSTKLEVPYNRIHEIRNRFEILRRDAHIEYLQKRLKNTDNQANLQAEFIAKIKKLNDDFAFIGKCNHGEPPLSEDDIKRLDEISQITFTRYFSRMVGLSWNEKKLIPDIDKYSSPQEENLLSDRPEQINALYNQGELTNLKIRSGTINNAERAKINEHITTTIDMLNDLALPEELANVVEYAGCHHERVDGKGYPNGLTGDQMSIPAKIMAIADVFEALTAKNRPYKEAKKLSTVLNIMRDMKNSGHLDPDLYELFIKSGVYLDYAKEYLDKDQIDKINAQDYL